MESKQNLTNRQACRFSIVVVRQSLNKTGWAYRMLCLLLVVLVAQSVTLNAGAAPRPPGIPTDAPDAAIELVTTERSLNEFHIKAQRELLDQLATSMAQRFVEPFAELLKEEEQGGLQVQAAAATDGRDHYRQFSSQPHARAVLDSIQALSFHPEVLARLSDNRKFTVETWKRRGKTTAKWVLGGIAIALVAVIVVVAVKALADSDSDSDSSDFPSVGNWFSAPDVVLDFSDSANLFYTYEAPSIDTDYADMTPAQIHEKFKSTFMKNPLFLKFLDKLMIELKARADVSIPTMRQYFGKRAWVAGKIENLLLKPMALSEQQATQGDSQPSVVEAESVISLEQPRQAPAYQPYAPAPEINIQSNEVGRGDTIETKIISTGHGRYVRILVEDEVSSEEAAHAAVCADELTNRQNGRR